MTLLERSWLRAWDNLQLPAPAGLREKLIAAYREPHRHYHSLQHLEECIGQLDQCLESALRPGEVEIALWFHDAIYQTMGKSSERRSADWALTELSAAGAPAPVLERIEELIMATCHAAVPAEPDQQLLVDIDLAILGSSPARFAEYQQQVRAEYAWVPSFIYASQRKKVLRSFIARSHLYNTRFFRERCERQARANLQGAIS